MSPSDQARMPRQAAVSSQITASNSVCCIACGHFETHRFGTGVPVSTHTRRLKSNNKCKVAGRAGKQQTPCGMAQKSNSNKPFPLRNDKHRRPRQCKPRAGSPFKNITINLLLSPQPVAVLITRFWQENPFPNKV